MTTLDAPYWLRLPKNTETGAIMVMGYKRSYPSNTQWFREQQAEIVANEKKKTSRTCSSS